MGLFDSLIPTRENGQDIEASWFNTIKSALNSFFDTFKLSDISDVEITAPTNGQTLVYDSINELWKNGSGGGGGGLGQLENIAFIGKGTAHFKFGVPAGSAVVSDQLTEGGEISLTLSNRKGFTFIPSLSGELASVKVKIVDRGIASGSGNVSARLYATDGSGVPTGSAIDISSTINTNTLTLNVPIEHTFIFSGDILLNAGTKYAIMFQKTGTSVVNFFVGTTNEPDTENYQESGSVYSLDSEQRTFFHEITVDNLSEASNLTLSETCYISVPPLLQNRHKIAAGIYQINSDEAAYINVNRSQPSEAFSTVIIDLITNITPDGNKLIFAQNVDGELHLGITDPKRIRDGETVDLNRSDDFLFPFGSTGEPKEMDPAVSLEISNNYRQVIFLESTGGSQTVSANPQIAAGSRVGQELILVGTSNTNELIFNDGNGLLLNGPLKINQYQSASFFWNGASWQEIARR